VNAAEQAISLEFASKIGAVVHIFKSRFPDLRVDLKPWASDPETLDLVDPDSIDLGFHFPGVSRPFKCRSLLVQIRFFRDPQSQSPRLIGVDISGFDHRGKRWNLSTVGAWQVTGDLSPMDQVKDQLKDCCRQIFDLFDQMNVA
jgi:hypothetical protein